MKNENLSFDDQMINRTIELAHKGCGKVSPNPKVGAVITRDNVIIAEGWHKQFGDDHAEVMAVKNSSLESFEGFTLYVNLEPCSHQGKTPPCADMIIERKFSKVVIGMTDPNPKVSGSGIEKLKNAGIEVVAGVLEEKCKWLNRTFIKFITTGLPYIVVKTGQSIDGNIASAKGQSKWITSKQSRKFVHQLRANLDAVMVGSGTVASDNPELTVREVNGRNPFRIILDSDASLPLDRKVYTDKNRNHTIVCCSKEASEYRRAETLRIAGITILPVDTDKNGIIFLKKALRDIAGKMNIASILVEGGSQVFSSFLREGLVDEIQTFIAPKIFGNATGAFRDFTIEFLDEAPQFVLRSFRKIGNDLLVVYTKH